MNPFDTPPSAWPSTIAIILSLYAIAYGLHLVWPWLAAVWIICWW